MRALLRAEPAAAAAAAAGFVSERSTVLAAEGFADEGPSVLGSVSIVLHPTCFSAAVALVQSLAMAVASFMVLMLKAVLLAARNPLPSLAVAITVALLG